MSNSNAISKFARLEKGNVKLIVFDLDGVLVLGSNQGYLDSHHYALTAVGINLSREREREVLMKYWSYPHEFQLKLFIGDELIQLERACEAYESFLFSDRFFKHIRLLDGAYELITKLFDQGYRLAIATGMHRRQLDILFDTFQLRRNAFTTVMCGYDLTDDSLQKPHPFMLLEIVKREQIASEHTIYIGDSRDDIMMARSANITSVAVLTGNLTRDEAIDCKANYVMNDATHLLAHLQHIPTESTLKRRAL